MRRSTNAALNFLLNALVFYAIGRRLRGHRTGVRLGLATGVLSALTTLVVYDRADTGADAD